MKKVIIYLFFVGLLISNFHLLTAFRISEPVIETAPPSDKSHVSKPQLDLKKEAYQILKSKCNICHKRKNPFKVFNLRNMDRHAKKIHQQVFVYRRMPKGNEIKLTNNEYQLLKSWLKEQSNYKFKF